MTTTPHELLLMLAAPLLALVVLLFWLAMALKRSRVVNLKVSFLGLRLTAQSCRVSESQWRACRSRSTDLELKEEE